jgi:hypothetical protein
MRDINSRIERFSQAAKREQLSSPDIIQKTKSPSLGGGESTPGSTETIYATVIEAPVYPDQESVTLPDGRSYYTLRLLTDNTGTWADDTQFELNDRTLYKPDGAPATDPQLKYRCKYVDLPAPPNSTYQINHLPDETGSLYWERDEEIKVEKAIGKMGTGIDLRDFITRYEVNQEVPIVSRVIEAVTVWFIDETLIYTGPEDSASLRWDEWEKRAFACYK